MAEKEKKVYSIEEELIKEQEEENETEIIDPTDKPKPKKKF